MRSTLPIRASSASEISAQIDGYGDRVYGLHHSTGTESTDNASRKKSSNERSERSFVTEDGGENDVFIASTEKAKALARKDSLSRAQQLTLPRTAESFKTKSFRHDESETKGTLLAEMESARKLRQQLERQLAESKQREDDMSRENRRLERSLTNLQTQVDKLQAEARANKFSQTESTSRIRELERKLENEKNRADELERERETMKEGEMLHKFFSVYQAKFF